MKKVSVFTITLIVLWPTFCYSNQNRYFDIFISKSNEHLLQFEENTNCRDYALESWNIADKFILSLFNNEIKDKDISKTLQNYYSIDKVKISIRKEPNNITIYFDRRSPTNKRINFSQSHIFNIYYIPDKRATTYMVFYNNTVFKLFYEYASHEIKKYEVVGGPAITSFTTFRILRYDKESSSYNIIEKFETTNFRDQIIDKNIYKTVAGADIPIYWWVGLSLKQKEVEIYFQSTKENQINFSTKGCIPPSLGATHCKRYEIDWVLPPDGKLYATEFRWDIRDEWDDAQQKEVHKGTKVKLSP